jgi:hypothetical protein
VEARSDDEYTDDVAGAVFVSVTVVGAARQLSRAELGPARRQNGAE